MAIYVRDANGIIQKFNRQAAELRKIVGAINCLFEITDRKKMEEALIEGDRRNDEFLATLAGVGRKEIKHELNVKEVLYAQSRFLFLSSLNSLSHIVG